MHVKFLRGVASLLGIYQIERTNPCSLGGGMQNVYSMSRIKKTAFMFQNQRWKYVKLVLLVFAERLLETSHLQFETDCNVFKLQTNICEVQMSKPSSSTTNVYCQYSISPVTCSIPLLFTAYYHLYLPIKDSVDLWFYCGYE